jgi:hypothetical protein
MTRYAVTVKRTYFEEADDARQAVAHVLYNHSGPDDFTIDEVDEVEQEVPQAPLYRTIERKEWV